jgi:hypothetical protein
LVLCVAALVSSSERFGCGDCRNVCASCRHCIASLISISRRLGLSVSSAARAHSSAWRSYNRAKVVTARSTARMKPDTLHRSLTPPVCRGRQASGSQGWRLSACRLGCLASNLAVLNVMVTRGDYDAVETDSPDRTDPRLHSRRLWRVERSPALVLARYRERHPGPCTATQFSAMNDASRCGSLPHERELSLRDPVLAMC